MFTYCPNISSIGDFGFGLDFFIVDMSLWTSIPDTARYRIQNYRIHGKKTWVLFFGRGKIFVFKKNKNSEQWFVKNVFKKYLQNKNKNKKINCNSALKLRHHLNTKHILGISLEGVPDNTL